MDKFPNMEKSTTNCNSKSTAEPAMEGEVAKLKGKVLREWFGVVKAEGRTCLLKELIKEGMGTVEVENFIENQKKLRFKDGNGEGDKSDRENVKKLMMTKLENSIQDEKSRRKKRGTLRNRLEVKLVKKKNEYKKFINGARDKVANEREKIKRNNAKKYISNQCP